MGKVSNRDEENRPLALRKENFLTAEEFQQLTDVPAVFVRLGNIDNPDTRRAYQGDVESFVFFCGIEAR